MGVGAGPAFVLGADEIHHEVLSAVQEGGNLHGAPCGIPRALAGG